MVFEVYLFTVVTSFLTNIGLAVALPHSIKNKGFDYDKYNKETEEGIGFLRDIVSICYNEKISRIMIAFAMLLYKIIFVIRNLIPALIPVLNVVISTMKVNMYNEDVKYFIDKNNLENFAKKEEHLFGTAVTKKNNKFSKLNRKIEYPEEKAIIESLIIEGADRNQIVETFNEMKPELDNKISNEQENDINKKANSMLDYICMNADLNNLQKTKILKELKKVYSNDKIESMFPIDYTFKFVEDNVTKIKTK